MEKTTFGAGCFWGIEYSFNKVPGVLEAPVGYSGGSLENPTYQQVCSGQTGHAEVVQVKFDPNKVSFQELLEVFWNIHDPTTLNRQGPDVGTQYRSAILFHSQEQETLARKSVQILTEQKRFSNPIVTEISPIDVFYLGEEYHQRYFEKQGRH
ncbi:MAG: peptide-methionine (S)-S-oxide reductase MsrA [Rhodospirillales bacterium]|nr:peptide-methionine (S)-S-oxide reductase MsrA [Rhodospirillales bacterium]MDC0989096.1 peptide-methionine (S)-S-oxide reductase MsrA [Rhodospirillales bacterium]